MICMHVLLGATPSCPVPNTAEWQEFLTNNPLNARCSTMEQCILAVDPKPGLQGVEVYFSAIKPPVASPDKETGQNKKETNTKKQKDKPVQEDTKTGKDKRTKPINSNRTGGGTLSHSPRLSPSWATLMVGSLARIFITTVT